MTNQKQRIRRPNEVDLGQSTFRAPAYVAPTEKEPQEAVAKEEHQETLTTGKSEPGETPTKDAPGENLAKDKPDEKEEEEGAAKEKSKTMMEPFEEDQADLHRQIAVAMQHYTEQDKGGKEGEKEEEPATTEQKMVDGKPRMRKKQPVRSPGCYTAQHRPSSTMSSQRGRQIKAARTRTRTREHARSAHRDREEINSAEPFRKETGRFESV